jgi:hypothetical protein
LNEKLLETPFNRFALQRFWLGLSDSSSTPFSSEESVVLGSSKRRASWSGRTSPKPMPVVLRRRTLNLAGLSIHRPKSATLVCLRWRGFGIGGTRIMLHYPKIPGSRRCPDGRCVVFEKYDGTNLHWGWDREFGWHSFGTRRDEFTLTKMGVELFAQTHAHLSECVETFQTRLADEIGKIFTESARYRKFASLKVFTEFFGPNSFAGLHKSGEIGRAHV